MIVIMLTLFSLTISAAAPFSVNLAPTQAYISSVVGHAQSYSLSCESRSAADLLQYWGINISETKFLNTLGLSDNPDKGFVGDVNGPWGYTPPKPYGVHALPVAKVLKKFGLPASARYGLSFQELKSEIAAGRPVIVWVIGGVWSGTPLIYTAQNGEKVVVARYEHSMLAIGYDQNVIHLIDAGSGRTVTHPISNFKNSWAVLGNMAVTANLGNAPAPTSAPSSGGGYLTYVVKSGDYLSKIAQQFNVSWQDIAALNNITYPYTIYPGQVLKIKTLNQPAAPTPTRTPKPTKTPLSPTDTLMPTQTATFSEVPAQEDTATAVDTATDTATTMATATATSEQQATAINEESQPTDTNTPKKTPKPTKKATVTPTVKPQTQTAKTYTVQPGDYLLSIARKFGLNWQDIAKLNGVAWPYTIYAGQVLKLPGGAQSVPDQPAPTNPTQAPEPKPSSKTYVVKSGDYLVALGKKFGISWQKLASVNGIGWPYIIYPGQVLRIP